MGQRLSAAALQVRAELAEMENIYDMDDPPPHEQLRILIEIQRLRARTHAEYQRGMRYEKAYQSPNRLTSYSRSKYD